MRTNVLTIILLLATQFLNVLPSQAQCHIDDWKALKALYESTFGDNWTNNFCWEIVKGNRPPND